jgi:hypothetical protein
MTRPKSLPARRSGQALLLCAVSAVALSLPSIAFAADTGLDDVRAALAKQQALLDAQQKQLDAQAKLIEDQRRQIAAMKAEEDHQLDAIRATGLGQAQAPPSAAGSRAPIIQLAQTDPTQRAQDFQNDPGATPVTKPVGEAPPDTGPQAALIAALPQDVGVLTPKGHLIVDSSIEYDRSSANRLVFRGVEIVPGVNLGLIDANAADRDTGVAAVDLRYGLTRRLEIEARVPYVMRHDQLTVLSQQVTSQQPAVNQIQSLSGGGLGDIEIAARYQLNNPKAGVPYLIAGLRVKSRTGLGPYDVAYDSNGISTNLATGSGFWSVDPSITMLLPSDPVVIFATLDYLANISRNINRDLNNAGGGTSASVTHIGNAIAGNAINASVGFGFALNDRFSFSLGYSHSYVMETKVQLNGQYQTSNPLQVGALTMGWSYRLRPNMTLNNSFEFGVTSDAPNLRIVTRLPISF